LRLIKIGDDTEDIRRRVTRPDLLRGLDPGSELPVTDGFTRSRLLTQEQDTVEITHEALVRTWPRLRQWIDTDRAGNLIRQEQELDAAAAVWTPNHHDTAGLYRGTRLEAACTWTTSQSNKSNLNPAATAFIAASIQQEHRAARVRLADPLGIVYQGAIDELRRADDHVKGEPFSQGAAGGASQIDLVELAGHRPSRAATCTPCTITATVSARHSVVPRLEPVRRAGTVVDPHPPRPLRRRWSPREGWHRH
jgi:hypothetical protein